MTESVLVGDVGGTNVRFGIASLSDGKIVIDAFQKMRGDDFASFNAALMKYAADQNLDLAGMPAVFALAGPPKDGTVQLTNREDWTVSESDLVQTIGLSSARLVNDFAAMARAVPELDPENLLLIKKGTAVVGEPIIVAGPGTGFGVATLIPTRSGGWRVLSGEGGFMAFAPRTPTEVALCERLGRDHGYVYNELVCAGIGLEPVHKALCELFERSYEPMPPGEMLTLAKDGDHMYLELCRIRARAVLGAVGDLVLANGARGGVVLAGGVTERLVDYLTEDAAIARFTKRGSNTPYVEACPVHLMHDPKAPLIGAAALHLKDCHDA